MNDSSNGTGKAGVQVIESPEDTENISVADQESPSVEVRSETEDSVSDTAEGDHTHWRSRRRWAWGLLGLVVVAALITASTFAVVFGNKLNDRDSIDTAAQQATATASAYAVTLTSIDSQHLDQNFTEVLAGATGKFKDMYSDSSEQLKSMLVQSHASSQGKVVDSSTKSATKTRVVVLLFVDQTVTNSTSPDPRVDRSRIVMTMDKIGGRWLASEVEMV
ncbi:hypothetical protein [Nocardia vaccinii]|uniref:hypothetical protein n=1 Tax=Nocardia vaccinii TaxID=1822 RepID=UPI000830ADEC|nr:hypothetical protein [Nocardia vaccinii]